MTVLTTTRLRLEPCNERHLDGLNAINGDPEVMRYLGGRAETREETSAMIQRVTRHWAEVGYSWWSFVELGSGEIVGAGCIQNLRKDGADPDPTCPLEIGWRLRRDRWHQGLASEAARAMDQFCIFCPGGRAALRRVPSAEHGIRVGHEAPRHALSRY